ncbi:MAG: hypothetical protein QXO72_03360, partial [Sulfolobales archaeon]
VVKLYNLIKMGRYLEATKVQLDVINVRRVFHLVPTIPAVYEGLRLRGIDVGYPKPPLRRLSLKELELIKNELIRIGML